MIRASRFWLIMALFAPQLAAAAQGAPAAQRPITIDDHFQIREVEGPKLSPDAQWVAYTVKTPSLKEDNSEQRIWMVPFAGGEAVPLTAEGVSSGNPRWSPDGKYLAFLSARQEGKTQVWLLNRIGGEAQRLTETPQDVDTFEWSPDSKRLCLNSKLPRRKTMIKKAKTSPRRKRRTKPKSRGSSTACNSKSMKSATSTVGARTYTSSISPQRSSPRSPAVTMTIRTLPGHPTARNSPSPAIARPTLIATTTTISGPSPPGTPARVPT
jgi:Tol biopolymer transport system component